MVCFPFHVQKDQIQVTAELTVDQSVSPGVGPLLLLVPRYPCPEYYNLVKPSQENCDLAQ